MMMMDVRRVVCIILVLTLGCLMANGRRDEKWNRRRVLASGYGTGAQVAQHGEYLVEQLLLNCKHDLFQVKETIDNFEHYAPVLNQAISALPYHNKQILMECLQTHSIPVQVSREKGEPISKTWYDKFAQLQEKVPLTSPSPTPVHAAPAAPTAPAPELSPHLAPTNSKNSIPAPTKSTTPSPVPTKSKTPSPAPTKSKTPSPAPTESKTPSPAPTSSKTPSPAPTKSKTPSPAPTNSKTPSPAPTKSKTPSPAPTKSKSPTPVPSNPKNQIPAPTNSKKPSPKPPAKAPARPLLHSNPPLNIPPSSSKGQDGKAEKNHEVHKQNSVPIIVGVTTAGAFVFAALILLCFFKCRKHSVQENVPKDDRPFTLNDFVGGLTKRSTVRNSVSKSFRKMSFRKGNTSQNGRFSSMNGPLPVVSDTQNSAPATAAAPSAEAPIPPPPGPPPAPIPPPPGPPPPPRARPPPPPKGSVLPPRPPGKSSQQSSDGVNNPDEEMEDAEGPKTKLKPFFWDKVQANKNRSMVWHQVNQGSFQFNEELIEDLFGCAAADKNKAAGKKEWSSQDNSPQFIQLIDAKKAQNLSILLRALNLTTEEVCDALQEGDELPQELLQTLLRMAPSTDEELKLRLYTGEVSLLGPAERFLKAVIEIPFAFKRMDSLLFMSSLQEDISGLKESLGTLEAACKELKNSRLFLKLLEAVLKTGNRMNDGTFRGGAQAFKLDTLLKLADVKGVDGKTTLLHFVVQQIIRSEGLRAVRTARESHSFSSVILEDLVDESSQETEEYCRNLGLQAVSSLSNELENVKKASLLDADNLRSTMSKLGNSLVKSKEFLNSEMASTEEDSGFHHSLRSFVEHAENDITWVSEEEKRIMALVKSTGDYFHGKAAKEEALRLFVIVRDFLIILDKICNEVRQSAKNSAAAQKNKESSAISQPPINLPQTPSPDLRQRLFPAIAERRVDDSSSDDES